MLDQNTDRMWFVIGAVIVGAAIIFIANGTIPEIFASVTDSFEESSTKAMDVIDSIGISEEAIAQVRSIEDSFHIDYFERGGIHGDTGAELDSDQWRAHRLRHKRKYDVSRVESFDLTFNDEDYAIGLMLFRADGSKISNGDSGSGWFMKSTRVVLPEDAVSVRVLLGPGDRDGNANDSGITLDEFELVDAKLRIVSERVVEGGN